MDQKEFSEIVDLIRKEDPRYDRQAYFFMRGALDQTVTRMRKTGLLKNRRSNHGQYRHNPRDRTGQRETGLVARQQAP